MSSSTTVKNTYSRVGLLLVLCYLMPVFIASSFVPPSSSASPYKVRRIVIDAGHGGKDSGCSGKASKEKHIALAIALKLGQYISQNMPDVEVVYTRKKDVFVELHERAAIANRNNADVFLSIHCNSSSSRSFYGSETYVMGLEKTADNLEVARRENAVVTMESNYQNNYDGFDVNDPQSQIIFSLYQNAHLEQSIKLAALIENNFKSQTKRRSRGVKQESFLVLYKTTMPSVLIEAGFLSNQQDEKYLNTAEGQASVASAVYQAFKAYKQQMEGGNIKAGQLIPDMPSRNGIKLNNEFYIRYRVQLFDENEAIGIGNANMCLVPTMDIEENEACEPVYMLSTYFNHYEQALAALQQLKNGGFTTARIAIYEGGQRLTDTHIAATNPF